MSLDRIEQAVVSIYPEIHRRVTESVGEPCEAVLWEELSCCILSSQVKYATAVAAARALAGTGLLLSRGPVAPSQLEGVLVEPMVVDERVVRYRFPQSKARQLAAAHVAFNCAGGLPEILDSFGCAEEARRWLVANAPGLGPKQASMFLRNTGMTYDLAILDRHVVDYMDHIGLSNNLQGKSGLSTLAGYISGEQALKAYAQGLGMAVGLMDWAIWIVMRVFKGQNAEAVAI